MEYVNKTRNEQLQESMPHIINEIQAKLSACTKSLEALGETRDDSRSQRFHLWQLSNKLGQMVDAALNDRHEGGLVDIPNARLRFQVQERLAKFAKDISDPSIIPYPFRDSGDDMNQLITTISQEEWKDRIDGGPKVYAWINKHMHDSRGTGLEGDVNPGIRQYLFRQQCIKWEPIATQLVQDIRVIMISCYRALFDTVSTDSGIRSKIDAHLAHVTEDWDSEIDTAMRALIDDNQNKLLFTLNPEYTSGSQKRLQRRLQKVEENLATGNYVQARQRLFSPEPASNDEIMPFGGTQVPFNLKDGSFLSKSTDMEKIFTIHDTLESYYFIALWRFVDNVAIQVVERHLLGPKSPVRAFSVDLVGSLTDDELDMLAGEDRETEKQRAELKCNKVKLQKALERWNSIRLAV